ncbi:MAG: TadE/TadG family type IV pilus assembly protein [Beijerinckiaceae bacterium]
MALRSIEHLRRRLRDFAGDRRAFAALEFSLVLPVLTAAGLGGAETMRYLLIQKQVSKAAEVAASMVAMFDDFFRAQDEQFIYDTMQVLVPFAARDAASANTSWRDVIKVGVGAVRFLKQDAACTSNCVTNPMVMWRTGARTCGFVPYSNSGDLASVPTQLERSLGTLVVADVTYTYTPMFGSSYLPGITVTRSNFQQPRFVEAVAVEDPGGWLCRNPIAAPPRTPPTRR